MNEEKKLRELLSDPLYAQHSIFRIQMHKTHKTQKDHIHMNCPGECVCLSSPKPSCTTSITTVWSPNTAQTASFSTQTQIQTLSSSRSRPKISFFFFFFSPKMFTKFKFERKLLPRCMPHRSSAQKVYKVCKIPRRISIVTRSYVTIF